ncbi:unnamed protein product [Vitrella brassicaformis CCMP3155]|uniref:F-box domain-containing protein n=3 Tax=Vitrella brassicaformis TaxID=1169539 RepID=A0A0G4GDT8_VITBC|nr:unnamed protein product [Vitrella brassicaformis CCMP3155]|eukprot:CEM27562.1 unnamed protein product [Vitrella brassicaformis CCMP3155]
MADGQEGNQRAVSLPGLPLDGLCKVCDNLLTDETIALGSLCPSLHKSTKDPALYKRLTVTPRTHKKWRNARRPVLRELRVRLSSLQRASITTDEEVGRQGPHQWPDSMEGDSDASEDEALRELGRCEAQWFRCEGEHLKAVGNRAKYAKLIEASKKTIEEVDLLEETAATVFTHADSSKHPPKLMDPPRHEYPKLRSVSLKGPLWAGVAYCRKWRLPALETFTVGCLDNLYSLECLRDDEFIRAWLRATTDLTHLQMYIDADGDMAALDACPSLARLVSLGVVKFGDPVRSSKLVSVLRAKGAVGGEDGVRGRIARVAIKFPEWCDLGSYDEFINKALPRLWRFVREVAGEGICAESTVVTTMPDGPPLPLPLPHPVPAPTASDASDDDAEHDNGTQDLIPSPHPPAKRPRAGRHNRGPPAPPKRPARAGALHRFNLRIEQELFTDELLRIKAGDALSVRYVHERARRAKDVLISAWSTADVRPTFGDVVFEEAPKVTLQPWDEGDPPSADQPSFLFPIMPAHAPSSGPSSSTSSSSSMDGAAVARRRFPKCHKLRIEHPTKAMIDDGGLTPILTNVSGQIRQLFVEQKDSMFVGDGIAAVAPEELVDTLLECHRLLGAPTAHLEAFNYYYDTRGSLRIPSQLCDSAPYLLFTDRRLACRLIPSRHLLLAAPRCVHSVHGDVQTDFIVAVVQNTPGLRRLTLRETPVRDEDRSPEQIDFCRPVATYSDDEGEKKELFTRLPYPAYLATSAVDAALEVAGLPFVVVRSSPTQLEIA